jgi:hypothetical protein
MRENLPRGKSRERSVIDQQPPPQTLFFGVSMARSVEEFDVVILITLVRLSRWLDLDP